MSLLPAIEAGAHPQLAMLYTSNEFQMLIYDERLRLGTRQTSHNPVLGLFSASASNMYEGGKVVLSNIKAAGLVPQVSALA